MTHRPAQSKTSASWFRMRSLQSADFGIVLHRCGRAKHELACMFASLLRYACCMCVLARASLSLPLSLYVSGVVSYHTVCYAMQCCGAAWNAMVRQAASSGLHHSTLATLCYATQRRAATSASLTPVPTASRQSRSSASESLSTAVWLCLPRAVSFPAVSQSTA